MKILVVDDEPLAQQRLKLLLTDFSSVTEVVTANNGLQAIEICQSSKPDVVLLDIRMPAMDGLEAAGHIYQMEDSPAIIFTTAYDEYALEAFNVNAVDYLLKPVRREKLEEAIKLAKKNGSAIAIGHPYSITFKTLKESKYLLKDLELVYVHQL